MPLSETNYPPSDAVVNSADPSFLVFFSSVEGGRPWCPHCRDVEGIVASAFAGAKKPNATKVYVGSFSEWKSTTNPHPARAQWGVQYVPTIIKVQNVRVASDEALSVSATDPQGKEVGRVVKAGILDTDGFERFVGA